MVRAVDRIKLRQTLADKHKLDTVAGNDRHRFLQKIHCRHRGKLVDKKQQLVFQKYFVETCFRIRKPAKHHTYKKAQEHRRLIDFCI